MLWAMQSMQLCKMFVENAMALYTTYQLKLEQLNANITSFNIKLAPTVPAMCHYLFAININT
jgi:hypothetical protein